ncbi:MAG TPA: hypothetical protein PKV43_08595 [Armatimonadota bacterium]|nr:hypothetical protein [Armatimonadota bacterium]
MRYCSVSLDLLKGERVTYNVEARDRAVLVIIDPPDPDIAEWNAEELKELLSSAG